MSLRTLRIWREWLGTNYPFLLQESQSTHVYCTESFQDFALLDLGHWMHGT